MARYFPGIEDAVFPRRHGSLLKWFVVIAIIVAVLWYLYNKGYITLPFEIPGFG